MAMHRHWYRCDWDHQLVQWTRETPEPENSPCPTCDILQFPWASEDMTTAKFKSDNGISLDDINVVQCAQLDLFR